MKGCGYNSWALNCLKWKQVQKWVHQDENLLLLLQNKREDAFSEGAHQYLTLLKPFLMRLSYLNTSTL